MRVASVQDTRRSRASGPARAALLGVALSVALAAPSLAATGGQSGVMPLDPGRNSPWAWEPGMASAPNGTLYTVANHCALVDQRGVCDLDPALRLQMPDYTPLWASNDGGRSWSFVADPLKLREQTSGPALLLNTVGQDHPGGYDTDVAVAATARPGRAPLIYVVSAFEASNTLAVSGDNGATWVVAHLIGAVPAVDRPWLATDGACDLYLQYHLFTGSQNVAAVPRVERYDGCALLDNAVLGHVVAATPITSRLVEPVTAEVTQSNQVMAKLAVTGGRVYVAYQQCDTPGAPLECNAAGNSQSVHVAISRDRGATFTGVRLPDAGLEGTLNDGTWPMALGADGNTVAVAAVDTKHVYFWVSRDAGQSWTLRPTALDDPLGWRLASVPTVTVRRGTVAVSWYGSPPSSGASQSWFETVARSDDRGATFTVAKLEPALATTANGASLGAALYDDAGAQITSGGHLSLTYTQACETTTDPLCPGPPAGGQAHALVIRWARVPRPKHR